jgi:hypothetical protein
MKREMKKEEGNGRGSSLGHHCFLAINNEEGAAVVVQAQQSLAFLFRKRELIPRGDDGELG